MIEIEGHGREEAALAELAHLSAHPDLSRTIGWFTTIFPIRLRAFDSPSETIADTARRMSEPRNTLAYSLLRAAAPSLAITPSVLFNYLGQFDQTVAGLGCFRFSDADTGPWHSPAARRTHSLEINCLILHARLEARFTYSANLHRPDTIERLAAAFASTLRGLIRTPARFDLAGLDSTALARMASHYPSLEDIYPLSPMQRLFYTLESARPGSGTDQWHCRLLGPLDVPKLQAAWSEVARRHPALRTAYVTGNSDPVQIVVRDTAPEWHIADLRSLAAEEQECHITGYLADDAARPFDLTRAPLTRLALFHVGENEHRFVWTHHHLEIDGWSWPLIFRELSAHYTGTALAPARPYRDFIAWLAARPVQRDESFWKETLRGFHQPTPLPIPASALQTESAFDVALTLGADFTRQLQQLARTLRTTSNAVLQSAWALLLAHHAGSDDVVFGAAFSGRPADLDGAENIVGHFVNNLPIRARRSADEPLTDFISRMHGHLALVAEHQSTPLPEIHACSELQWNARLFSTLLVFQNYIVDSSTSKLGDIEIAALHAPVRTNYPLTLVANPGPEMTLTLIAQPRVTSRESAAQFLAQLAQILRAMVKTPGARLHALTKDLPAPAANDAQTDVARFATSMTSPAGELEEAVAEIWRDALGCPVGATENFFDLGGHSLLMLRVHARLCAKLKRDIPVVKLFQHPTIRAIARHLGGANDDSAAINAAQARAAKARTAFTQRQERMKR